MRRNKPAHLIAIVAKSSDEVQQVSNRNGIVAVQVVWTAISGAAISSVEFQQISNADN